MLPTKAINEFKKIYKARYGILFSDTEAVRRANNLVDLYKVVCKPASFGRIGVRKKFQPER